MEEGQILLTTSITHWDGSLTKLLYLTSLFSVGAAEGSSVLIYLGHFGGQSTAATILIATPQVEFSGWTTARVRTTRHLTHFYELSLCWPVWLITTTRGLSRGWRGEAVIRAVLTIIRLLHQRENGNQFVDLLTDWDCPVFTYIAHFSVSLADHAWPSKWTQRIIFIHFPAKNSPYYKTLLS